MSLEHLCRDDIDQAVIDVERAQGLSVDGVLPIRDLVITALTSVDYAQKQEAWKREKRKEAKAASARTHSLP